MTAPRDNFNDTNREYELHRATMCGDTEKVRCLLQQGINVDARCEFGNTALIWAAYHDYPEIISLLVKHGAD